MSSRERFPALVKLMRERGYDQSTLGALLGIDRKSVSRRMTGAVDWTLSEMYAILSALLVEPSDIHSYFPPQQN